MNSISHQEVGDFLVENLTFIQNFVRRRYSRVKSARFDLDDLVMSAVESILRNYHKWKPSDGRFFGWALLQIRNASSQHVRAHFIPSRTPDAEVAIVTDEFRESREGRPVDILVARERIAAEYLLRPQESLEVSLVRAEEEFCKREASRLHRNAYMRAYKMKQPASLKAEYNARRMVAYHARKAARA